jgi:ATP-binding cassette, subfamily B, bacterial
MAKFPFFKQLDTMDCGPSCLRMVAKFHGQEFSLQKLRDLSYASSQGVSLLGISDAAEKLGLQTLGLRINYDRLQDDIPLPCIVHWKHDHFIVVHKIKNDHIYVADPAFGHIKYTKQEFVKQWATTIIDGEKNGLCLVLEPTPQFNSTESEIRQPINKSGFKFLFGYLKSYKGLVFQLILGMLLGSLLQLIFPFLTQSIVDYGISNADISFINLVLLAQLVLFVSRMSVEMIRGWILLHLGTRINVSLISDFLMKLMKLPLSFFDAKHLGDIIQRIGDHKRIESFLTSSTLNILFSMFNLVIFGVVLATYDLNILIIFIIGSALYAIWIYLFLSKRKELDWRRFTQMSKNQSAIIQLVNGMQEIKLNNCEKQKRWEWEDIQARLFKVNIKHLALKQYQSAGGTFINGVKNIIITFIAAKAVIDGSMTLGMLIAVQYILGQLNTPINQMLQFFNATQDAKISLERLGEIHDMDNEESDPEGNLRVPDGKELTVQNLSFQYEGPNSRFVLKDVELHIPKSKTTAIVGVSGSGKTTLIKLLLGFYKPTNGKIKLGKDSLVDISKSLYRQQCGVVMQDGFIFSDSIAGNIAPGLENINKERLLESLRTANIESFIDSLPLGVNTKIGSDGHGLSHGQKQRILIARAVYKDPDFLFFDEATNALDANNERIIMDKLNSFFKERTAVVVAHRLSTVRNADNIVVLDEGSVVEQGTHTELTAKRGAYYELVKNQLELGN